MMGKTIGTQEPKAPEIPEQGTLNVNTSEKALAKAEKSMRQILDEQPKVKMIIPEDPNNPDDVVPVGINGVIYAIPRGVEVEVPKSVYDVWKYSYDQTAAVNRRIRESVQKEVVIMG